MKSAFVAVGLLALCLCFLPMNVFAAKESNNEASSFSEYTSADSSLESLASGFESNREDKNKKDSSETESQIEARKNRANITVNEKSNRFTIGWVVALAILVASGVAVYAFNRRKK